MFYEKERYKTQLERYILNFNELNTILKDLAFDYQIYGNAYLLIEVDKKEITLTRVENDFIFCKSDKEREGADYFLKDNNSFVDKYPYFTVDEETGVRRSLIVLNAKKKKYDLFANPLWTPIRNEIIFEYYINSFQLNEILNSFVPSAIITVIEEEILPTFDDGDDDGGNIKGDNTKELADALKQKAFGFENAFKVLINSVKSKDQAPIVNVLSNIKDGHFSELSNRVQNRICGFNGMSLALAGLETGTNIGSNVQLVSQFNIMNAGIIQPLQATFLETFIEPIKKELLFLSSSTFREIEFGFKTINPISLSQFIDPATVLTQDEQRALLGYQPLNNVQI